MPMALLATSTVEPVLMVRRREADGSDAGEERGFSGGGGGTNDQLGRPAGSAAAEPSRN